MKSEITNEEFENLIIEYSSKNQSEVFSNIDMSEDNNLKLDVDQGFIDLFEEKYPSLNIDEYIENYFGGLVKKFLEELNNPLKS